MSHDLQRTDQQRFDGDVPRIHGDRRPDQSPDAAWTADRYAQQSWWSRHKRNLMVGVALAGILAAVSIVGVTRKHSGGSNTPPQAVVQPQIPAAAAMDDQQKDDEKLAEGQAEQEGAANGSSNDVAASDESIEMADDNKPCVGPAGQKLICRPAPEPPVPLTNEELTEKVKHFERFERSQRGQWDAIVKVQKRLDNVEAWQKAADDRAKAVAEAKAQRTQQTTEVIVVPSGMTEAEAKAAVDKVKAAQQ